MKNRIVKNVSKLMVGNVSAQIIGVITVPILTRLYEVDAFGKQAIFISIINIVSMLVTGGYNQAVVVTKYNNIASYLYMIIIGLTAILTMIVTVILYMLSLCFADIEHTFAVMSWLGLLPIAVLSSVLFNISLSWLNRFRRYSFMASMNMLVSITNFIVAYILLKVFSVEDGLLYSAFAGNVIASMAVLFYSYQRLYLPVRAIKHRCIIACMFKYRRYPEFVLPSNIIHTLCVQFPVFVLQIIGGDKTVANFAMVQKVLGTPISFIGNAINQVYIKELSENLSTKGNGFYLHIRITTIMALLGIIPFSLLMVYSSAIIEMVLGVNWGLAGKYCEMLSPMYYMAFVSSPVTALLLVSKNEIMLLRLKVMRLIGVASFMILPYLLFLTVNSSLIGYGIGYCVYYSICIVSAVYKVKAC